MQWLAEISVKRPVFASVLVLSLVVVGVFAYFQLGRGPVPQGRLPDGVGHHASSRRGARGDRDRDHRQDRAGGQHHRRHRRAPLGLDRRRLPGLHPVQAREERRRRGAGGARQGQPDPARPAAGHRPARRRQDRSRRGAGPVLSPCRRTGRSGRSREFADKTLRREIESISAASARSRSSAAALRQVNLWLDPARLRAYSLTAAEVARAVANQNLQLPGGSRGARARAS